MTGTSFEVVNRLPDPGAGFIWDTSSAGTSAPVLRTKGTDAVFTTRLGGVSVAPFESLNVSFVVGDRDDDVRQNRAIAGRAIGAGAQWSVVKQVHGGGVVRASPDLREADAVWTDRPGDVLAVLSADCVLVLLAGDRGVACAHAGWRGLLAGVVEGAARRVGAHTAFAGPAIGPCCFEVSDDLAARFRGAFGRQAAPDHRHVDLWHATREAAERSGVASFEEARLCTSCNRDLFFSHRRDAARTGRQALLARFAP